MADRQTTTIGTLSRIAEFVIEKAMGGHFAYFKLVLDLVDGKRHPNRRRRDDF